MINEPAKQTLTKLYVKEKLSLRAIAKMYGRSYFFIRYRSIKYGIKFREKTWNTRKINIDKAVLEKLYIKEGKSSKEVADILSCSSSTILKRCKEYEIPLRRPKVAVIPETLLKKLYVEEGKTTREIAKQLGCSCETIRKRCHEFCIPLRSPGTKKIEIDEVTLRRMYVEERKSESEIAKMLHCSNGVKYRRVEKLGLKRENDDNHKGKDQNNYQSFSIFNMRQ